MQERLEQDERRKELEEQHRFDVEELKTEIEVLLNIPTFDFSYFLT